MHKLTDLACNFRRLPSTRLAGYASSLQELHACCRKNPAAESARCRRSEWWKWCSTMRWRHWCVTAGRQCCTEHVPFAHPAGNECKCCYHDHGRSGRNGMQRSVFSMPDNIRATATSQMWLLHHVGAVFFVRRRSGGRQIDELSLVFASTWRRAEPLGLHWRDVSV